MAWLGGMPPDELAYNDAFPIVPSLVAEGVVSSDRALSVLQEIDGALKTR